MLTRPVLVVLDACVLANAGVADVLLRLAETPHCLHPRWSEAILQEVRGAHRKLGWPDAIAEDWQQEIRAAFDEAMVPPCEASLAAALNHPKDRHVLATALASGARLIVTFNLRDFDARDLAPVGVEALSPDDFLRDLLDATPQHVDPVLDALAERHGPEGMLRRLSRHLPVFAQAVAARRHGGTSMN